jgi:ketosteroid isomerase-like protein
MPETSNGDLVRQGFDALSRGDLETWRSLMHPEVEWHDQAAMPGSDPHAGIDDVQAEMERWLGNWHELSYEIQELIEDGDEIVVVVRRSGRQNPEDDLAVDVAAYVILVEDGKLRRFTGYSDRESAVRGGGLRMPR